MPSPLPPRLLLQLLGSRRLPMSAPWRDVIPTQEKGKRGAGRHRPACPRSHGSGASLRPLCSKATLPHQPCEASSTRIYFELCGLTSCVSSGRWSPFLLPSLISLSRYLFASGFSEALSAFSWKTKPMSTRSHGMRCPRAALQGAGESRGLQNRPGADRNTPR